MSASNYTKYKARYERGGCTKEQLRRLVELGALTEEEYRNIVGKADDEPAEEELTEEE